MMATTPTTFSMAKAPKLTYKPVEEYLAAQKANASTSTLGKATGFFQNQANGTPSTALSAAIAANREAMARQAATLRGQAAQTLAKGSALGQGTAVRGMQDTERNILQTMADSRSKELQALGTEQTNANKILMDQANSDKSSTMASIQAGLNSSSPAVQSASQRALAQFLNANGVQMGTEESAAALNDFAANAAENDPLAQAQKVEAEQTLSKAKMNAILSGTGSAGQKMTALYQNGNGSEAYNTFMQSLDTSREGPKQADTDFWNKTVLPILEQGGDPSQAIAKWNKARSGFNLSRAYGRAI